MKIELRNIGVIGESKITLDGLTVITGKNGSGKTTVCNALAAMIVGASEAEDHTDHGLMDWCLCRELKKAFFNQAQTIGCTQSSEIALYDGKNQVIFHVRIEKNDFIPTDEENSSYWFPQKRLYYVDNHTRLYFFEDMLWRESITEKEKCPDRNLLLIDKIIDSVLPGSFDFTNSGTGPVYIRPDGSRLPIYLLAGGSIQFACIKLLLSYGLLDEKTFLIMEAPETNLHPDWQNRLAELVVLLVKLTKVRILLTTHSSNFMLAIDAYMRKHEINEQCNFYHAEQMENGMVTHKCVNEHMELIYQDFVTYFADMKVLRDRYAQDQYFQIDGET